LFLPNRFSLIASFPVLQWLWMLLSDKSNSSLLMIFNPIGSFFYGMLGPAFTNIWTTVIYCAFILLLVIYFCYSIKIQRNKQIA
jgi:hypothetical protein